MERLSFVTGDDVVAALSTAVRVVRSGGVIMLPTETFYGLAADPASRTAVDRVYALKGRPDHLSLPVLCCDWQQVENLVVVPEAERPALRHLWPGPVTAVLRLREQLPASGSSTLAVRVPGHDLVRALLYRTGPLTGTSANRSRAEPAVDTDAALRTLNGEPDLVLDGGLCPGGGSTTIVDLTQSPARVLRQGAVRWCEIWSTKP